MTEVVVPGPWRRAPVRQPAPSDGVWWRRTDDGRLWVWCSFPQDRSEGWHRAPVPMAKVTRGIPKRSPNRDRITCALDMRCMYGPEVDEALGVADALDTVVDSWEGGTAVPTEDELRRLATLTGFMPEWFYQGTLPTVTNGFICGRGGCRSVSDA